MVDNGKVWESMVLRSQEDLFTQLGLCFRVLDMCASSTGPVFRFSSEPLV